VIDPAGRTASEVASQVENWIESEMRRIAPHRYAGQTLPGGAGFAAG
jgi:1-acyl-sn-glycerol-3-phosphate acyltransferase